MVCVTLKAPATGVGVGVGIGVGVGEGDGVGAGVGLGVGEGTGVGEGVGVGTDAPLGRVEIFFKVAPVPPGWTINPISTMPPAGIVEFHASGVSV